MKNLLLLLTIICASQAFARNHTYRPPLCQELFSMPNDVPIGFTCVVNEFDNEIYERVERKGFGIAWKDSSGLIWSDWQYYLNGEKIQFFDDAWTRCENLGAHLPLMSEYNSLRDTHSRGGYIPMKWARVAAGESFSSEIKPRDKRPYLVQTGNAPNYTGGMADRRDRSYVATVCVDDTEVVTKPARPARPTPVQ